ncbi:hypothetical protein MMPV_003436 [Pyropia vietnamensis]
MLLLPLTLATAVVSSIHKAGSRTRQAASALVHHGHHGAAAAPADVPPPPMSRAAGVGPTGPAGRRMSMEARRRRSSVDGSLPESMRSLRAVGTPPGGGAPRQATLQRRASTGGAPLSRERRQLIDGDRFDGRLRSSLDHGRPRSSAAAAAAAAAPRRRSSLGGSSVDSGRRVSMDRSRAAAAGSVDMMMDPPVLSHTRSAW